MHELPLAKKIYRSVMKKAVECGASAVVLRPAVFDCAAEELPELLDWMTSIKEA